MTENDFNGLFGDDFSEINEALKAAEAEVAAQVEAAAKAEAKQDGLWYVRDEDDANGHAVSIYAVNASGKTLLWVRINNFLEIPTEGIGHVPAGITGHAITIVSADGEKAIATKGIALKAPHQDGTGTHIDGQSVRVYILPRLTRFIGELYGV